MPIIYPGLRSRSRDRSWSRSESTVLAGVGVGAGVGEILPTPTSARSRRIPPVNRRWFWPNGYAWSRKHWNTGGKAEWQCGDKVGLAVSFSDRIWSEKSMGDNFRAITNVVWLCQGIQRRTTFKGISNNHGRLHLHLARTGAVLPHHPFGCNEKRNKENGCLILIFLWCSTSR